MFSYYFLTGDRLRTTGRPRERLSEGGNSKVWPLASFWMHGATVAGVMLLETSHSLCQAERQVTRKDPCAEMTCAQRNLTRGSLKGASSSIRGWLN